MKHYQIRKSFTSRECRSVDTYLKSVAKESTITQEEEIRLFELIAKGDDRAREKIIRANMRFVVTIAKQYSQSSLPLEDLIEDGNAGLIMAVDRFDPNKGFKFISYAVWWIRQQILDSIHRNSYTIRIPVNKIDDRLAISAEAERFEATHLRKPTPSDLSESLGINVETIKDTIGTYHEFISIESPAYNEDDTLTIEGTLESDEPSPDYSLLKESVTKEVDMLLLSLSPKYAAIMRRFFGIGCEQCSVKEIGDEFGISSQRIRQIKDKCIAIMRIHYRRAEK